MRADEDGLVLRGQQHEQLAQLDARARVEAGRGLVEDEHVGVVNERAAQRDALLHALGERLEVLVQNGRDAGEFLHRTDCLAPLRALQAVGPRIEIQILVDGHVVVRGERVGHVADAAARILRLLADGDAVDEHVALGRLFQRGDDAHGGGLARAVRPDEAEDVAVVEGEREVVHGHGLAEAFVKSANLNFHFTSSGPSRPMMVWRARDLPGLPRPFSMNGVSAMTAR